MKLTGIDVSAWQHGDEDKPTIDWDLVKRDGYGFAMVKCTQGTDYVNPWLDQDVLGAHEAGLYVGCYHFGTPTAAGGEAEARFALQHTDHLPLDWGIALDL